MNGKSSTSRIPFHFGAKKKSSTPVTRYDSSSDYAWCIPFKKRKERERILVGRKKKKGNGERRLRRKINGGPAGEFLVFRRGGKRLYV